ncbi:hypothetical protein AVEN_234584-1 [Araneus ventricosus]|uniref:Uncharacterized protein n=1 Tax=Araneus ventricosus TaxID=182803 RepID=A0A4Y2RQY5_ARAVE|nr:hypothetical protein AVEN_234584-1 [Araneus ventricosus]
MKAHSVGMLHSLKKLVSKETSSSKPLSSISKEEPMDPGNVATISNGRRASYRRANCKYSKTSAVHTFPYAGHSSRLVLPPTLHRNLVTTVSVDSWPSTSLDTVYYAAASSFMLRSCSEPFQLHGLFR